jgi:hypothetical protein
MASSNWFTKLFGGNSRKTDVLADRLLNKLQPKDVSTIKQYIVTEGGTGLTRKDIYTFCLRYPQRAEKIIEDWFDDRKVVENK